MDDAVEEADATGLARKNRIEEGRYGAGEGRGFGGGWSGDAVADVAGDGRDEHARRGTGPPSGIVERAITSISPDNRARLVPYYLYSSIAALSFVDARGERSLRLGRIGESIRSLDMQLRAVPCPRALDRQHHPDG